jgi:LmbE family N-acetylglucosaminyl deacetylase
MKKVIFGVFAHPDDEAFGPSGTLLMEKALGNEIHLICATAGENGTNPGNLPNLGEVRLEEWKKACSILGADSMHHLGYTDGTLSNKDFHEMASLVDSIVHSIIGERDDIEVEFMSIDLNGITGHIDHITVGRVACYVYCNLKEKDPRVSRMRLACISREQAPTSNCHWLYMDAGRTLEEIGETVDASEHLEAVKQIMHAHHTQRQDCETHLREMGDDVAINHFLVI